MHDNIKYMLDQYKIDTIEQQENALIEIVQEIVLLGLSRDDFFKNAAFYGGTALRILYKLNRFSEDLDFTGLHEKCKSFEVYKKSIEMTLAAYGFSFEFIKKQKNFDSPIESAFLKGNTSINFLQIGIMYNQHKDSNIKIKLEIDRTPALGFIHEAKLHTQPEPFYIQSLDLPSLLSGKLHAILFRERRLNIKGRDWYDLSWYLSKKVHYNFDYLCQKIKQTMKELKDHPKDLENISELNIKQAILSQIEKLDLVAAKKDVIRFLRNPSDLDIWSHKYFTELVSENLLPKF